MGDVEVRSCLGHSEQKIVEFSISGEVMSWAHASLVEGHKTDLRYLLSLEFNSTLWEAKYCHISILLSFDRLKFTG